MYIESVVVSGPGLPDASIYFSKGANVVQGGSDTGKSYIVQCIKYALGSSKPPKPIKLSAGYASVKVTFRVADDKSFAVERTFDPKAKATFINEGGQILIVNPKSSSKSTKTISSQFLQRIGLDGKTLLFGQESLRTNTFSLRDLEKIVVIDEARIVAEYSPIGTGQYAEQTKERSILKLLLTGADDAEVKKDKKKLSSKDSLRHKVTAVEALINQLCPGDDLEARQLIELEGFEKEVTKSLQVAELELKSAFDSSEQLFTQKSSHLAELDGVDVKLSEDKALLERFSMLGKKYESDRQRLLGIQQASQLLEGVSDVPCPTCGSHMVDESCPTDVEDIQRGVSAELGRITSNLEELSGAQSSLSMAVERYTARASEIRATILGLEKRITSNVQQYVENTSDIKELLACIRHDIGALHPQVQLKIKLTEELKRLGKLLLEEQTSFTAQEFDDAVKPLIEAIQSILARWDFPDYLPVGFDLEKRDITIGGSDRGNFGKGYRAIAFSAFILGLMNLLKVSGRHPGFVVLDSPLTTYKEGDEESEDESSVIPADLIYAFYSDIAESFTDTQVIIFENKEPDPLTILKLGYQHFTKSRTSGRYGFFPLRD